MTSQVEQDARSFLQQGMCIDHMTSLGTRIPIWWSTIQDLVCVMLLVSFIEEKLSSTLLLSIQEHKWVQANC